MKGRPRVKWKRTANWEMRKNNKGNENKGRNVKTGNKSDEERNVIERKEGI